MSRRKSGSGAGFGSRRMAVEQLEGRSLLAGVVSAFVSGGSLIITGDNSDNAVVVQDQGDGNYAVTGFDFADVPGLTGFKAGPTRWPRTVLVSALGWAAAAAAISALVTSSPNNSMSHSSPCRVI